MQSPVPYKGPDPYIFISYAHRDSEAVKEILLQMQQDGYRVWFDLGIDPGTEWDQFIARKVIGCDYFIAFISKNYLASSNCKDELNYARDLEKGLDPDVPSNYFPGDDPTAEPMMQWRSHAYMLFSNWLNYFVYQETPFDF